MVWYIQNISDQPDHCSKHQLRRKISEKKTVKEKAAAERNDQRMMLPCVLIWPCYHQGDVVCLYLSILRCICQQSSRDGPGGSPVTKAPSPSFATTLWEGQTPQQNYIPLTPNHLIYGTTGWRKLEAFRRGQKWPQNFLSGAYLLFSRQMRRFCA